MPSIRALICSADELREEALQRKIAALDPQASAAR